MSSGAEIDYSEATDGWLLFCYRRKRDERAFGELVQRHHALVLGVARRILGCPHSAEDVLQATFLVLAKDAHKIRKRQALASWLYGVAFRIAARQVKRRARLPIQTLEDKAMVADDPLEKLSEQFEQQTAFEELNRLPESVRAPMVLRYLQGKSNAEVAESLRLSESAVEGRLKRGRQQLRLRLARQGVAFAAAIAVLENTKNYALAAPDSGLVTRTMEACLSKSNTTTDVPAGDIAQLANEEMLTMTTTMVLKNVAVGLLSVTILATGWSLIANVHLRAQEGAGEVVVENQPRAAPEQLTTRIQTALQAGRNNSGGQPQAQWTYIGPAARPAETASSQSGSYSLELESYGQNEKRILAALNDQTSLSCRDESLSNVIAMLSEDHQIQIVLYENGLAAEGVTTDLPITADFSNIRLESALSHILEPHRLAWMIKHEMLVITSRQEAEKHTVPRVYRINTNWQISSEELIRIITSTVATETWDQVGGPSHITAIRGGLVISTNAKVHAQVNDLLRQIEKLMTVPEGSSSGTRARN